MEALPAGPERDAATTALVEKLTSGGPLQDSEAAFAWALSMSGENERSRYTATAVQSWSHADPNAARASITASSLPDAEKQKLLLLVPSPNTHP